MSPSIAVPTLADAVADAMREQILSGKITAGTLMSETDMAREYDIARPTAKAAIERLVSVGLLTRSRHKSARVPKLGADDVEDVYLARSYLESMAARTLAVRGGVPTEAESAIARLRNADTDSVTELVEPDIAFHRSLVDAAGSKRVTQMHRAIMGEMQLTMAQVQSHRLLDRDVIVADHYHIINQVRSGDADAASEATHQHLNRACGVLLRHFELGS